MPAHAAQEFEGFKLDERRLRKLVDIVEARLRTAGIENELRFDVYRSDHAKFTAGDLSTVLKEENSAAVKIVALELTFLNQTPVNLRLSFRKERGCSLLVEGDDRDLVFLVYSDLRAFIVAEVERRRGALQRFLERHGAIFLFFGIMTIYPILMDALPTDYNRQEREWDQKLAVYKEADAAHTARLERAIQQVERVKKQSLAALKAVLPKAGSTSSEDVARLVLASVRRDVAVDEAEAEFQKIFKSAPEYPEYKARTGYAMTHAIIMLLGAAFGLLVAVGQDAAGKFEERYLFLIGEEIRTYERRRATRERIVWGVAIAFIVGVLASLVAAMLWAR